eukprot:TRINITY_DN2354_c0_g1_i2.p1 TRINITY_DN2354_c0_g1~~TRINITY_DN2354_c0_g1_i2.p1  ORF type:complete len:192 (-),score=12.08 TRINITY_DN2354_c0_g1_i2:26-601(-)
MTTIVIFVWRIKTLVNAACCNEFLIAYSRSGGALFASCKVGVGSVEQVLDSSRYFVLKIEDGKGNHAFIGLGYNVRNDAFDFNATLQDFQRRSELDKVAEQLAMESASRPPIDFSLQSGASIHVSIPGTSLTGLTKAEVVKSSEVSSEGDEIQSLLPPPPAGNTRRGAKARNPAPNTVPLPSPSAWTDFMG